MTSETRDRETLERDLASVGCHPRSFRGQRMFRCPMCSHQRKKKSVKCLSVKSDHEGAVFRCHHCEWHGGFFFGEGRPTEDSGLHVASQEARRLAVQAAYGSIPGCLANAATVRPARSGRQSKPLPKFAYRRR